jgi:endonuclease III
MPPPSARDLLLGLQSTLKARGVDYEQIIKDLGQVEASEARESGRQFTLRDHLRGLLLSLLSNQRPWKPIADNLEPIRKVFLGYDPDALAQADPMDLEMGIRKIHCGNRAIAKQMNALHVNIETLRRIEKDHGSLDEFVTSSNPDEVAEQISKPGRYKLRQVGYTLAQEYLKNVGIRAAKPDSHIRRILGGERLSYFPGDPDEKEAADLVVKLAADADCSVTYLDNLLWLFCADGYGEVCGDRPKCDICAFHDTCRYPTAGSD